MDKLIEVKNVTKKFYVESPILKRKIKEIRALSNVSFTLNYGETLGIVGESGSGKTTLGKIIAGFIQPDEGKVFIENQTLDSIPKKILAQKVQMIFQDPFASLNPRISIGEAISEAVRLRQKFRNERKNDTDIIMEVVGLLNAVGLNGDILDYFPHQFSGGQRQRIAIARALAMNPKIFIADEPLSNLDFLTQARMVNLFLELKHKFNLSIIFISHDILLVDYISDRILVLKDGEIVEESYPGKIFSSPQNDYTKKLIEAVYI